MLSNICRRMLVRNYFYGATRFCKNPDTPLEDSNNAEKSDAPNVKALQEKFDELQVNYADTQDRYKRALAEIENNRKRHQKQIEEARLFAVQGFSKDLLEVFLNIFFVK